MSDAMCSRRPSLTMPHRDVFPPNPKWLLHGSAAGCVRHDDATSLSTYKCPCDAFRPQCKHSDAEFYGGTKIRQFRLGVELKYPRIFSTTARVECSRGRLPMRPSWLAAAMVGAASVLTAADAIAQAQCSRAGIPLPDPILLTLPAEFSCELKTTSPSDTGGQPGAARGANEPGAEAAELATKLDYQRQCYRQAKTILRDRMQELQASVVEMAFAINGTCPTTSTGQPGSKASIPLPDWPLLLPPADVTCEIKDSPNAAGAQQPQADTLRTKLDYERQCYRQYEMILRNSLQLLQAQMWETIKT